MPFTMPTLKHLNEFIDHLDEIYITKRREKDLNRFLGSIRPYTDNPVRTNAIATAKMLKVAANAYDATLIELKELGHGTPWGTKEWDRHLLNILTGIIYLQLADIRNGEYKKYEEKDVIEGSVLTEVMAAKFGIQGISEIPADVKNTSLTALSWLLNTDAGKKIEFPGKTRDALLAMIQYELESSEATSSCAM